ncbi:MAG: glycosyltransferase family 39 protein, partial [Phycisphaerales bacterium]|nr:glycosyltransferase family 39 protein [Phycisphaerales bacterium]
MAGPKAWTTPMLFAERQYGHYPTLGIGKHYPPGFAVVEAVFFVVFGVSEASARLCVAFFGVLAAAGVYAFVRTIADRLAAMLAALLMIAIPATTHWGRQAMLEIPTLAVLTWSAVAFSWYLRQRTWRRFAVMAGAALLTILFKQTAVFLICAIAMALTWSSVRGRGPWSHAVCAVVLGLSALGLMLVGLDDLCLKTVSGYDTFADRWGWSSLTFYLRTLPEQTGMIVLPAAALGALLTARRMSDHWWLLAAWLFTSYVMVTVASLKTPRFFYVGLFPLVVGAAFGAARCVRLVPSARLRAATAVIGCACIACAGFARPVPDGPDFGAMVTANRERIEGKVVLFSGLRDGDFIFA